MTGVGIDSFSSSPPSPTSLPFTTSFSSFNDLLPFLQSFCSLDQGTVIFATVSLLGVRRKDRTTMQQVQGYILLLYPVSTPRKLQVCCSIQSQRAETRLLTALPYT